MFGCDARANFKQFAPNARRGFLVSLLLTTIGFSIIIFPLILLLPLTIPLTLWYSGKYLERFVFTLDEDKFFVRKGVFLYSYTMIPYENVQDIHVTQSFTDMLFGMWSVVVFTATVGGGAVTVPALGRDGAGELKDMLFAKMKEAKNVTD